MNDGDRPRPPADGALPPLEPSRTMDLRWLLCDPNAPAVTLNGLSSDSRQIKPGEAFVACRGAAFDGHDFVEEAVAAGAVAVICERSVETAAPSIVVPDVGKRLGQLGRRFHGAPSRELAVVGVTGTNGKTSVAYNIAQVADAGSYIGTLGWGAPPALCPSQLTTAGPLALQAQLRALKQRGAGVVALETSSHALDQGRVDHVDFAVGVFTNLSRDHLDYHGSMKRYAAAKRKLFERNLRVAVVNVDDATGASIAENLPSTVERLDFGRHATVGWSDVRHRSDGIAGVWHTPWGCSAFTLPGYFGEFSVYNAAATLSVCCALGKPLDETIEAMAKLGGVPGRMQRAAASPTVLIDYAHTPDGLRAMLAATRSHLRTDGRVIVVFGCGGDRDRGKRAEMAQAAEAGADVVVVTSDNPRSEDPDSIARQVVDGLDHPDAALCVVDRRRAIATALQRAQANDIVVIAGKGHENTQQIGDRKLPFSDLDVVRELTDAGARHLPGEH